MRGNSFFDSMIIVGNGKVSRASDCLSEKPVKDKDYYRQSAYERTKAQVYATGNKWAIENFHATHD